MSLQQEPSGHLRLAFAMALLGVATTTGVCWPITTMGASGHGLWWLQLAAMAGTIHVLHRLPRGRTAFLAGLWFATGWLASTFWWLFISMYRYGGLPAPLAVFAVLALACALGAYYAFAFMLYRFCFAPQPWSAPLLFSALWTMAEMARGTWLTGFGWGAVGYAHEQGPLASLLPMIGVYGVGAIAALLAAILAAPTWRWQYRAALAIALVAASLLPSPAVDWTQPNGTMDVALLQGNIAQNEKFEANAGIPQALEWYAETLIRAREDLVVAPETAIPLLPTQLPDNYWARLQQRFAQGTSAAMVGIPLGSLEKGYTNSVVGLVPGQQAVWEYHKHHLVPFGEFIPPLFRWFTRMMNIPLGDFQRGGLGQPSLAWKSQRLAAHICYEDLFGEELAVRFNEPLTSPTIFVNVSNIAWFGDSVAIDQHLQIARVRALELQRAFVRATNTGATAVIDHHGQVQAMLPRHTRGVLRATVEGRTGTTPYAWWAGRWGLWPLWLMAIAVVLVTWRMNVRRTGSNPYTD